MTIKTPDQIAEEVSQEFYEFGAPEDGIRSGYLETGVVGRMIVAAIEADRAQRNTGRRVLTAPGGWRVGVDVDNPREFYETVNDLLDDYTFNEIAWED